jgi:membrane protein
LELEPRDWKKTATRTVTEIKGDRVTLVAAGMAYYFFLAIFPAFLAIIGILDLMEADASGLIESVRSSLPKGAGQVLTDGLAGADDPKESASLVAAIVGIALALWSASSGMIALQKGLNVAYDVKEDRKFIGARLIALALILATGLLGGVPSPIFTFGESTIFQVLGWALTVAAVVILFSLYYYLAPNRKSPAWQWVSAGGLLGAALWILTSVAFGYYVAEYGNYGKTYGPAAGVIVLIFWLFLTSISVLVGGELNAELERQSAKKSKT